MSSQSTLWGIPIVESKDLPSPAKLIIGPPLLKEGELPLDAEEVEDIKRRLLDAMEAARAPRAESVLQRLVCQRVVPEEANERFRELLKKDMAREVLLGLSDIVGDGRAYSIRTKWEEGVGNADFSQAPSLLKLEVIAWLQSFRDCRLHEATNDPELLQRGADFVSLDFLVRAPALPEVGSDGEPPQRSAGGEADAKFYQRHMKFRRVGDRGLGAGYVRID